MRPRHKAAENSKDGEKIGEYLESFNEAAA